jgi:molybdopterin-guanine dinucleotide biosynthesis protein A
LGPAFSTPQRKFPTNGAAGMDSSRKSANDFVKSDIRKESSCVGVTGVILAGGNSSRMKSNKALLPFQGELFIERIYRQLASIFRDIILVTNKPELYSFLPCTKVADFYPGMGSLAGIHAGLSNSKTRYIFVVACDMPLLNASLIRRLVATVHDQDIVMPEGSGGLEPLHAVYGKGSLPVMEEALSRGKVKIVDCCEGLRTTILSRDVVAGIDPEFLSFRNINTPEDYFTFREEKVFGRDEVPVASLEKC